MLKNFLKVAFRSFWRYKSFSAINIAGLTFGLTACLLIGLFVWDEYQYDKNIPNGDQVYRIYNKKTNENGTNNLAVVPPMFATTLKKDFAAVEQTARVMMLAEFKFLFEVGDKSFYDDNGSFVDSTFLEVLPQKMVYGSPVKALDDPKSILLSEDMAKRLFGNVDPVGKQLQMNKGTLQVKAVFKKDPKFHLQFNFLCPLAAIGLPAERMKSWGWQQFFTYVKVKKEANVAQLEQSFKQIVHKEADNRDRGEKNDASFQPLSAIHLHSSDFKFDNAVRGNITYVKALSIIAGFILLIACFNFINLATAKSLQRAKEVGVRKTIGAEKKQLIVQFTGETVLLTFISVLVAYGLTLLFLPWLNSFTGKQIPFALLANPVLLLLLLALTFVTGILAGFYPALVLSGFKPVKVLKSSLSGGEQPGKTPWLRHGLVVTQFTLSVLLIISALVVYRQVNYLHNKDLGFSKDQIMFFPIRGTIGNNQEAFKTELLRSPGIASVSIGYGYPGDAVAGDGIIVPGSFDDKEQAATQLTVDHDYVKTLNLRIIAGRDFSKEMSTDKDHAFIINETAVRNLGFKTPENALGKKLAWHPWGARNPDSLKTGNIIGVVQDFNYKSLYDEVETAVIQIFPDAAFKVAVKMKTADFTNSIEHVRATWNKFVKDYPIEYKFLDDNFEKMYTSEDKLTTLLWIFTAMAIFVGCLGLLGLAAFTAERRRKEVSIRKVLGASVQGMVLLLSKDFIKLVAISLLIASPIAWYFMDQWLTDFAYRLPISWWIFAVTAIAVMGIAFLTVSIQAIRAATSNPVKSLRSE